MSINISVGQPAESKKLDYTNPLMRLHRNKINSMSFAPSEDTYNIVIIFSLLFDYEAHLTSFSLFNLLLKRPRETAEVMSGRSVILTTLFLDKPPG